jgi:hypothetical protein
MLAGLERHHRGDCCGMNKGYHYVAVDMNKHTTGVVLLLRCVGVGSIY